MLKDQIEDFLGRYLSLHTQGAYRQDLENLFYFCKNELYFPLENINQITEKLLILWVQWMKNSAPATTARRLASVSAFFQHAIKKKWASQNPALFMKRPKISRQGKTSCLTAQEVQFILECAKTNFESVDPMKNLQNYLKKKKEYIIAYALFSVGMRVEELCSLRMGDVEFIDAQAGRLHMVTKGGLMHSPWLHPQTLHWLRVYKEEQRQGAADHEPFFVGRSALLPLHRATVYRMITSLATQAGIEKPVSPHSCRVTLATLLHQQGVPLGDIQDLLSHKQLATTSLYIRASTDAEHAAAPQLKLKRENRSI